MFVWEVPTASAGHRRWRENHPDNRPGRQMPDRLARSVSIPGVERRSHRFGFPFTSDTHQAVHSAFCTMAQASAMYPDMMMWYPDFEPPPKPMLRRSSSQKWGPYATHNFDRDEMKSLAALKAYQNMPAARARNIKDSVGEALWVTGDAQRKAEMSKQNRRVRKVRGFACVCILPDSVLTIVLRVDARRIFARPTTSPTLTAPPSSRAGGATSPLHGSPGRRTRS